MDIQVCGSVPSRRGPADSFTGVVWQEPIIEAPAPARLRSGLVRFEPGARTHWHTHPLGQTLFVVSGAGRVQTFGGKVREIKGGAVGPKILRSFPRKRESREKAGSPLSRGRADKANPSLR